MREPQKGDFIFDPVSERFGYIERTFLTMTHGDRTYNLNLLEIRLDERDGHIGIIFRAVESISLLSDDSEQTKFATRLKYA